MTWDLLTESEKGYLAGIVDGKGSIFISKSRRKETNTLRYSLGFQVQLNRGK